MKIEDMTYEQAVSRLEEIVSLLEKKDTPLDESVKLFEEGTKHKIDEGDCYCKLGNLAYMRGETDKAADYYRKAAKLNNARALLNIAIGYLNKEIRCFRFDEVKCFLAKSSALGNRRAFDLLKEIEQ